MYDLLPKNERTFSVDLSGEDTFLPYKGEFTVKCIVDMGGKHAEELEKTRLMADYANPSDGLYGVATSLAKLRSRVIKSPQWWQDSDGGTLIRDQNVVMHLYSECLRLEEEWRTELKEKAIAAQKENSKTADSTPS